MGNYTITYTYNSKNRLSKQNVHYVSPTEDHEWNQQTEFHYKNGRIYKAVEFNREGEIIRNYSYKYDSNGNTLEKVAHVPGDESGSKFIEINFRYDTKVNPHAKSGMIWPLGYVFSYSPDIKQINNPVYCSYENMILSRAKILDSFTGIEIKKLKHLPQGCFRIST